MKVHTLYAGHCDVWPQTVWILDPRQGLANAMDQHMYLLQLTNCTYLYKLRLISTLNPVSFSQKCHCCDSTLALCYLIRVSKRQPFPNRKSNPEGIQSTLTSSVIILAQPFLLWLSVVIVSGTGEPYHGMFGWNDVVWEIRCNQRIGVLSFKVFRGEGRRECRLLAMWKRDEGSVRWGFCIEWPEEWTL